MEQVLICYSYYETDEAKRNLQYFLGQELKFKPSNVEYNIVIQGFRCSIKLPEDNTKFHIIKKKNHGYDFGAHYKALTDTLLRHNVKNIHDLPYEHYIFLNSGAAGPFVPNYVSNVHWTTLFCSKFTDQIKLIGSSLVCLPKEDLGGFGPKVEGFCFALDKEGLDTVWNTGTVFYPHESKNDVIVNGEYGLSRSILEAGFNMDSMVYRYSGVDWRVKYNWKCNNNEFASRCNSNDGISLHPFETIFHKTKWQNEKKDVQEQVVAKYIAWNQGRSTDKHETVQEDIEKKTSDVEHQGQKKIKVGWVVFIGLICALVSTLITLLIVKLVSK